MESEDYSANAPYAAKAVFSTNDPENPGQAPKEYVTKTVVGYYTKAADMTGTDITDQIFGAGYSANYSSGVIFTFDTKDGLWHFGVKTYDYVKPEPGKNPDTRFVVTGALEDVNGTAYQQHGTYRGGYLYDDGVSMHDDYWERPYNYQTLFVLNEDGTAAKKIVPTFNNAAGSKVFASGAPIESGKKEISGYTFGEAIPITVHAEDEKTTENYYVTCLTPVDGSHLFVNGATNSVKKNSSGKAGREVRINVLGSSLPYHDIFLANYGTKELTGLKANAEELTGVEFDKYWTIKEGSKLAAFTTVEKGLAKPNGELPNVGKVRLVPTTTTVTRYALDDFGNAREETEEVPHVGPISGKVTISTANSDSATVRITGNSSTPEMLTTELPPGVQFVHYSCVLMTNCNLQNSQVKFECISDLPKGLSLKQNGEIYGVPQEAGDFEVEIRMWYEGYKDGFCTTTKLPVHIDKNDNEFVDAANEGAQGYPFKDDGFEQRPDF